jgi:hypothetical protein
LYQRDEACTRRVAILRLRAMLAAVDEEDTPSRHSLAGERQQALLDVERQRRSGNVETQFDRRRDLVDVLSARLRCPDEPL